MELKTRTRKRKRSKDGDAADCCRREEQIVDLRRELGDVTVRLQTAKRQKSEMERVVRAASDRIRELEASLDGSCDISLESRAATVWRDSDLMIERPGRTGAGPAENVYVFGEGDAAGQAFDEFFSTPDPHLEKIRNFLLS